MKVLLIVVLIVLFIFIDKIVDFAFGCVRSKGKKQDKDGKKNVI